MSLYDSICSAIYHTHNLPFIDTHHATNISAISLSLQ
jgi:hypothetical protein